MLNGRQIVGLKSGLLALSLAFTLVFVFVGFGNHMDPFYWLDKIVSRDYSFMTCGTVAAGVAWTQLFGISLVSLRALAWLCCAVAIALPYGCLLSPKQRRENLHWLAVAYMLMGYGTYQEYSAGSLSMLMLSAVAVAWMKYRTDRRWLMALPVLAAVAVSARFPNLLLLVALPILMALDGWAQKKAWKKTAADILLYEAGTVLVLAGIYLLLIGTADPRQLVAGTQAAAEDSHSLNTMITALYDKAIYVFRKMVVMLIAGGLLFASSYIRPSLWRRLAQAGIAVGMLVFLYAKCPPEWYNKSMGDVIAALVIMPALYMSIRALIRRQYGQALVFVSMLFIGAIEPMGSDTAWMKLFPMYLAFLPYIFTHFAPVFRANLSAVVVPVCLYAAVLFVHHPIGREPLYQCHVQRSEPVWKNIYISRQRSDYLDRLKADYSHYSRQGEVLVMGDGVHVLNAMMGCGRPYKEFYALRDKPEFVAQQMAYIAVHQPVVMFVYTPEFIYPTKGHGNSLMEQQLLDNGYSRIARTEDTYYVYVPTKMQE